MINFSVEFKPGLPIYEQVVFAVKKSIVSGQLKQGDPFPSVRELSKELRINPNTAQKAVTHLVQERLLEVLPGIGTRVSAPSSATTEQRQNILGIEVERLVVEAQRLFIKKEELIKAIGKKWTDKKGKK